MRTNKLSNLTRLSNERIDYPLNILIALNNYSKRDHLFYVTRVNAKTGPLVKTLVIEKISII